MIEPDTSEVAVRTYLYLRLSMVLLLVALAASVLIERSRAPECWQTSISAYYYTPVRAVFVGVLVAVGAAMVVIYGNTRREDLLLNLGGMLAPVVALVPTQGIGLCSSVPLPDGTTVEGQAARRAIVAAADPNIDNNTLALVITAVVAVGVVLLAARLDGRHRWGRAERAGAVVSLLVVAAAFGWFVLDRAGFRAGAHNVAAGLLFATIIGVVLDNALDRNDQQRRLTGQAQRMTRNRYAVLAALMVGSAVVIIAVRLLSGWDHWLLVLEAVLIALFAAFWLMQTLELRETGARVSGGEAGSRDPRPGPRP